MNPKQRDLGSRGQNIQRFDTECGKCAMLLLSWRQHLKAVIKITLHQETRCCLKTCRRLLQLLGLLQLRSLLQARSRRPTLSLHLSPKVRFQTCLLPLKLPLNHHLEK